MFNWVYDAVADMSFIPFIYHFSPDYQLFAQWKIDLNSSWAYKGRV